MVIEVRIQHDTDIETRILLTELVKEIRKMPSIQEVKDAVAEAAQQVTTAIQAAITTETTEIAAQIQALKDQVAAGGTISQADLDGILAPVQGIGAAVSTAVAAISDNDGAGSTAPPTPPTPPAVP